MSNRQMPPLKLPDRTPHRDSPDFEHIPWWTTPDLTSVLTEVPPSLWCLLSDLTADPDSVDDHRLHIDGPTITRLMSALWMRRPIRPATPASREIPDQFTALLTVDIAAWREIGRLGAAWCLARLATFARHLNHPVSGCVHHRGEDTARIAWYLLTHAADGYLYTPALAARYDLDRPLDAEFVDAITTIARTSLTGKDTIEFGAGTGAITTIIAPYADSVLAIEPAVGMRRLLTRRAKDLRSVRVSGQDCMSLDLPSASADTVIEHSALCFVDEPLCAVTEACRLLRPGGTFVRILSSRQLPDEMTAFTAVFHAELRRLGNTRGRIVSSGNDQRITDWLADTGIPTRLDTIATWTSAHPLHHYAAPLRRGSYPYLSEVSDSDLRRAIDVALATTRLAWDTRITTQNTVATATSAPRNPVASHPDRTPR